MAKPAPATPLMVLPATSVIARLAVYAPCGSAAVTTWVKANEVPDWKAKASAPAPAVVSVGGAASASSALTVYVMWLPSLASDGVTLVPFCANNAGAVKSKSTTPDAKPTLPAPSVACTETALVPAVSLACTAYVHVKLRPTLVHVAALPPTVTTRP